MKLWESGNFSLDDDVSEALHFTLRNPSFPNTPITYRMLLSHQSSIVQGSKYDQFLSDTYNLDPPPTVQQLLTPGGLYYSADIWLDKEPGTYFAYSNTNFGLLGTIIEDLSKLRFDIYMRKNILGPLNITGSYNVRDLTDISDLAVLYRNETPQADDFGGVMPPERNLTSYNIGTNGFIFGPQGGLRIDARELGHILNLV